MCEEHAAAGIACPPVESIGSAVLAAPKVIAGLTLGVCAAVAVSFVVANIVWIGLGVLAVAAVAGTVLVRKTRRNLRDGRDATWHPALAQTPTRVNGVRRRAVEAPCRPAVEAPRVAALPAEVLAVMEDRGLLAIKQAGYGAWRERNTP